MKRKRSIISLLTAWTFVVLAVTGVLAFVLPFSIQIVGLHALIGFVFIVLIALHVLNNQGHLRHYLRTSSLWITLVAAIALTALFIWRPAPVRAVLGLSKNIGPALDRLHISDDGLEYSYAPSPDYKMRLSIRAGAAFDRLNPPDFAIWLENGSAHHIKTLHSSSNDIRMNLPYWDFKVRGWEEAKRKAGIDSKEPSKTSGVDSITAATLTSSFDPADYILPTTSGKRMPYKLLIEINPPNDDLPSLVYSVEIDNADPHVYQLLELEGYPQREDGTAQGKEVWALYYVDERFEKALDFIDSALLTIERRNLAAKRD